MKNVEIEIGTQTNFTVQMGADVIGIDEVVVTAFGIRKDKKALGYSVQAVSEEDLARTGNNSLLGAMQGKLAGVDIKPSSGMWF